MVWSRISVTPNEPEGGRKVQIREWSDDLLSEFPTDCPIDLVLNEASGWILNADLAFLTLIPNLRSLSIVSRSHINKLPPLPTLQDLHFACGTYAPLNFENFPSITSCAIPWSSSCSSLLECLQLKNLFLSKFKFRTLEGLQRLNRIERLSIVDSPVVSLRGIEHLTKLKFLELAYLSKLEDLSGIEYCSELETLWVATCKRIESVGPVGDLKALIHLRLDNCGKIETFEPLLKCLNLQSLKFIESTNLVDGNLRCLLSLPKLAHLNFQNRRHYTHGLKAWHVEKFPHLDWPKALRD